jgi:hypothetical protein
MEGLADLPRIYAKGVNFNRSGGLIIQTFTSWLRAGPIFLPTCFWRATPCVCLMANLSKQ